MADEETEDQAQTETAPATAQAGAATAQAGAATAQAGAATARAAAAATPAGHAVVVAQPALPSTPILPKVSRRNVVIIGFWTGMGAMLAAIAVTIVNTLWPRNVTGFGGSVFVGTVDKIGPGEKFHNVEAKAWVVRLSAEQAARNPGGQEGAILALYQKCPHLGCTVPYRADFSFEDPRSGDTYPGWFRCPCHGSTYSDAGVRVFGPAPRSMDTFALTIDGGNITVNTGDITPGNTENASRGVLPG